MSTTSVASCHSTNPDKDSKSEQLSEKAAAGSGKTLVSVLLVREVLQTRSSEAAGKKAVFLAPTVSLVQQVRMPFELGCISIKSLAVQVERDCMYVVWQVILLLTKDCAASWSSAGADRAVREGICWRYEC